MKACFMALGARCYMTGFVEVQLFAALVTDQCAKACDFARVIGIRFMGVFFHSQQGECRFVRRI